jgi:trimeric autotransporter adhesin
MALANGSRNIFCGRAVLCLLVLLPSLASAQNLISTVAGGGSVNGPTNGANADLPALSAVVQDTQGNTYIAVPSAQQVYKVDPTGATIAVFAGLGWSTEEPTKLDGGPAVSASLNQPTGVAVDNNGNVYIADSVDYLIRQVDTSGNIHTIAGNTKQCQNPTSPCGDGGKATNAQLTSPYAVATDSAGNVYIADTGDNRIRVVNMQSKAIRIAGVTIKVGAIETIAGNGNICLSPTSACGDGGPATSANLYSPQGVAVDAHGNVFFSDTGDHRVRLITGGGTIEAYAGNGNFCNLAAGCGDGGPATSANLTSPWQVSVDGSDNLYIADAPENKIRMVNAKGMISSVAGDGTQGFNGNNIPPLNAELNSPRGVFINSTTGNFLIADTGNQMVRQVASNLINTWAGGGSGNDGGSALSGILAANRDVALDSAGNLYIADTANNRIRKVSPANGGSAATITTVVGTGTAGGYGNGVPAIQANLNAPYGVFVDSSNNIYISDTGNLVIREVNASTGIITTIAGVEGQSCSPSTALCGDGGPATAATFAMPISVAVDNLGNVYVADAGANRIRVFAPGGTISTFAGNGTACASPLSPCGDGAAATAAQLNSPFGVAADNNGNIYIADTYDNRIRIVNGGNINAYAFNGQISFGPDKALALDSSYSTPMYIATDPKGNLYVSGSTLYYVVQRVDVFDTTVQSVAGRAGDPKYYGYAGDGTKSTGSSADINNYGATIDGSGNLYISDGGNNRIRYVPLVPTADTSTLQLNFPPTPIGQQSQANMRDTNQGLDDMYMTGPVQFKGPFTLASVVGSSPANTCATLIAPGQYCTYTITYTASGYGLQQGYITISDNAWDYPVQKVTLNGYGPDYTIAANPSQLTIAPGNQGSSTITLTPSAGFNQTVDLVCTGAPSGTTCGMNPNQVPMNGVNNGTSTMSVNVGSTTAPGNNTLIVHGTSVTNHDVSVSLTVP